VCGVCGQAYWTHYDKRPRRVRDLSCGDKRVYLSFWLRRVSCSWCGTVKNEGLDWLADNPLYTKRFAFFVGRRCHDTAIKVVAEELYLDWHAVKELEKQYMREQLRRAGLPAPRIIGIDEISVGKGHEYRIVVTDLERGRAIWFGGKDRSEKSMDEFFAWLGPAKCSKIRVAVMDMWPAFRNSTLKKGNAPQAVILYDKFHIMKHLGEAMDKVRKQEYARLSGADRRFIKGQKYTLLSHWGNLTAEGRASLRLLFQANARLNKAYLLKESFDQLWDYRTPGWARRFFDQWCDALRWQRLKPFQKFARMIEIHWDGIETFCHEENKQIPLGFVEGFNNKIRVLQRRAYGLRDEDYLRLKILTCMLPKI
jgi:transposase